MIVGTSKRFATRKKGFNPVPSWGYPVYRILRGLPVRLRLRLGSTVARPKLKGIDGGPHKRWSMWFNSIQRAKPYQPNVSLMPHLNIYKDKQAQASVSSYSDNRVGYIYTTIRRGLIS
ncbi:hypothetical protein L484_018333 [Morus notabilis]|uniref:Uncharacterized protein n=1 Tax=Morus notabilis TaxID=981085 RepID=W9QGE8_9ROSA|nr:hypothetical protein L484_018333 [Morus notabilis]